MSKYYTDDEVERYITARMSKPCEHEESGGSWCDTHGRTWRFGRKWCSGFEDAANDAADVLDVLAPLIVARALRDEADRMYMHCTVRTYTGVRDWLKAQADEIEAGR